MKQIIEMAPLADYYVVAVKDKQTGALEESFTLNESAADILRLICEGYDTETIAQEIANKYETSIELITSDVSRLLDRFRQKGLF